MRKLGLVIFLMSFISLLVFGQEGKKEESNPAGKKAYPINIPKGDLFNDGGAELEITEENAIKEGAVSLKITFKEKGNSCGMWNPKMSNWSDFKFLKMIWVNPSQEIIKINFVARDDGPDRMDAVFSESFMLRPGKNSITISLENPKTNTDRDFNLKKITHWYVWCPVAKGDKRVTLYLSDVYLTTEE